MKLNFSKRKDRLLFLGLPCLFFIIFLILIIILKESFIENIIAIFSFISIGLITLNAIILIRYDSKKFSEKHGLNNGYIKKN